MEIIITSKFEEQIYSDYYRFISVPRIGESIEMIEDIILKVVDVIHRYNDSIEVILICQSLEQFNLIKNA